MSKNKLTLEEIQHTIKSVNYHHIGKKTTVCLITLKNGYEIVGTSGCVDPENYDAGIGEKIAYENAQNKIWELEGYVLQEKLFGERIKHFK